MNNLFKLAVIFSVIYGGYKWFNINDGIKESDWVNHQFSTLNVKASFPSKPRIDKRSIGNSQIEFATAKEANNQYVISLTSGNSFSSDDMYPYSLTKKGAVVQSEKDVSINGYIGKEYQLILNEKSVIQRFVKYKGNLVTQLSIYKRTDATDEKVLFFFKSLVL